MSVRPARPRIVAALMASLVALGCEGQEEEPPAPKATTAQPPRVKVRELVDRLMGPDEGRHSAAEGQLMALAEAGFPPKDGVRLLRAAAGPAPRGRESARATLVRAAAVRPGPDDIPAVVELFPRYDVDAKRAALELLARLPGRDAAEALMGLVRAQAPAGGLPGMSVGTLAEQPRHADVFFPALLEQLGRPELREGICRIAAAFAEAGLLDESTIRPHADRLVDEAEGRLDALGSRDGPDDPDGARRELCGLLDLLVFVPTSRSEAAARRALLADAPEVRAHAVVALVRQGRPIGRGDVNAVAARPEARLWLWRRLGDLGRLDVLPLRYRTQAAVAESELADWLARSPRLGRPPDEIRAMGSLIAAPGSFGPRRFFLFRFRVEAPADLADRGWMAGWVSYPPDFPGPAVGGLAGSRFLPWGDRTPLSHVADGDPETGDEPDP